jgi:tellurite resistance protein
MRKTRVVHEPGRRKEEQHFRRQETELIQELRRKEAAKREHAEIRQVAGLPDDHDVAELKASGFDRETIRVLHLVPLLEVAWADGKISKEERLHILEAARLHGVEPDSRAHRSLASWLEHRPGKDFFRKSLRAIRAVLHTMEPEQKQARKLSLLSLCTKVAVASGGFFGLGSKISAAERALLAEISSEVGHAHGPAAKLLAAKIQEG